jgi:hypothetical protein
MREQNELIKNRIVNSKIKLLEALEKNNGIVKASCDAAQLGRTVFYEYYNTDPDFKQRVEEIRSHNVDIVESKLYEKINAGDTTAIIFYLKTQGRSRGYAEEPLVNNNIIVKFADD